MGVPGQERLICPRSRGPQVADLALPRCADLWDVTPAAPGNALGGGNVVQMGGPPRESSYAKPSGLSRGVRAVSEAGARTLHHLFCLPGWVGDRLVVQW